MVFLKAFVVLFILSTLLFILYLCVACVFDSIKEYKNVQGDAAKFDAAMMIAISVILTINTTICLFLTIELYVK